MKIKFTLLFISLFIILLGSINVFSYVTYPQAILTVDKNEINVGETVNATVEITIPPFAKLLQTEDDISIDGWDIQDFHFKQDILDEYKFTLSLSITTFNSNPSALPRVKLSYVNKDDLLDDSFFCDKFKFFSNSVSIKVNSILPNYERDDIFDIKNLKRMNIPIIYHILCILFVLFVVFVVYGNILMLKTRGKLTINFSSKEKAIRNLNNICSDVNKIQISDLNDYYYQMSRVLKIFILDGLSIENKEMTTTEVLSIISEESNPFYKIYNDIIRLFKICDNAKYSIGTLSLKEFCEAFNKIKKIIETLDINIKTVEGKND